MMEINTKIAQLLDNKDLRECPQDRIKKFILLVVKTFSFLENYGYKVESINVENTKLHKCKTNIVWHSNEAKRELSLRYLPFDHEGNLNEIINIDLLRVDESGNESNESKVEDNYLNFQLYFLNEINGFDENNLKLSNYEGDFSEKMTRVLKAYSYYIKDAAYKIIKGEDWVSGYFHRWN